MAALVAVVTAACGTTRWTAANTLCSLRAPDVPAAPSTTTTTEPLASSDAYGPFEDSVPFIASVQSSPAPPDMQIDVVFGLVRSDTDLARDVRAISDPCSPTFHQYRSAGAIARDSGASAATRTRVVTTLQQLGATTRVDATGSFVEATMSAAQVQRLFDVPMRRASYRDGSIYFAPAARLQLPAELSGSVDLVLGLDGTLSQQLPRPGTPRLPASAKRPPALGGHASACAEMRKVGGLAPNQLMTAYGVAPLRAAGLAGQDMSVAVGEEVGVYASDVNHYTQCLGLPNAHLVSAPLGGPGVALSTSRRNALRAEATADAEIVAGVAPQLRHLYVLEARDYNFVENLTEQLSAVVDPAVVGTTPPAVFSLSFEECERRRAETYAAHAGAPRASPRGRRRRRCHRRRVVGRCGLGLRGAGSERARRVVGGVPGLIELRHGGGWHPCVARRRQSPRDRASVELARVRKPRRRRGRREFAVRSPVVPG